MRGSKIIYIFEYTIVSINSCEFNSRRLPVWATAYIPYRVSPSSFTNVNDLVRKTYHDGSSRRHGHKVYTDFVHHIFNQLNAPVILEHRTYNLHKDVAINHAIHLIYSSHDNNEVSCSPIGCSFLELIMFQDIAWELVYGTFPYQTSCLTEHTKCRHHYAERHKDTFRYTGHLALKIPLHCSALTHTNMRLLIETCVLRLSRWLFDRIYLAMVSKCVTTACSRRATSISLENGGLTLVSMPESIPHRCAFLAKKSHILLCIYRLRRQALD